MALTLKESDLYSSLWSSVAELGGSMDATLWLVAPGGTDSAGRLATLDRWYRREINAAVPALLAKWEPIIGVEADAVVVRRMKAKWGTYTSHSRTIWPNSELAKKNPRCLEYIVVHELTHLLERGHGNRFAAHMDWFLPGWRQRRDDLNEAPLAQESWT